MLIRRFILAFLWPLFFFAFCPVETSAEVALEDAKLSFDRDIRPILSENCFACHGFDANAREADLRLDTRAGAIEDGGVIVPENPAESILIERIESEDDDERMPPPDSGRHLTSVQREKLRRWIAQGANYEQHWAFVAPQRPILPRAEAAKVPIDRFIGARLESEGLTASGSAESWTLLRRVSLDLTGLPPSLDQMARFERDAAEDLDAAYTAVVDQLLASPHYGERWGRWWLDQARYADSHGYSVDAPREIWKFRDWVVEVLNANMPFDQFTLEQLAGDLLPEATVQQRVATGFHRNTQINQEGGVDPEQFRIDSIFDRVATTGTVWLGLSIGCAQCHDHKFDPISQEEFYRLFAFLNNQNEPSLVVYPEDVDALGLRADRESIHRQQQSLVDEFEQRLHDWLADLVDETKASLPPRTRRALAVAADKRSLDQSMTLLIASGLLPADSAAEAWRSRESKIAEQLSRGVSTLVLAERSEPRTTSVLVKGDFTRPAKEVSPGTPSILPPLRAQNEPPNRLDLAHWIMDPENPLTARVIVNRIWQQYFGRGLVETENDFGLQGSLPSHPQLLDWLAVDFRESGWNLKALHRQIVLSHTYRQSSKVRTDLHAVDPLNTWLSRQNRLRLDAEIVRDVALVASGLFSPRIGGPPVFPPIPAGVMSQGQTNRAWNANTGDNRYRRGLYTFLYRVTPPPSLSVFDAPDGLSSCTRRMRSNTPLQALTLMNDAAFHEFAIALTKIIEQDGMEMAFQRCTSRRPTLEELALLRSLDSLNAARALLNLDETINRE